MRGERTGKVQLRRDSINSVPERAGPGVSLLLISYGKLGRRLTEGRGGVAAKLDGIG